MGLEAANFYLRSWLLKRWGMGLQESDSFRKREESCPSVNTGLRGERPEVDYYMPSLLYEEPPTIYYLFNPVYQHEQ
jgi:hypothetical protein